MKKISLFISLFFIIVSCTVSQNYKIDVTIKELKDSSLILGHYFEKKILVNDTITLDDKGKGSFEGSVKLPEGIYVIYLPDKTYFDFLIGADQQFSIQSPATDFLDNLNISGSAESENFLKHQKFLNSKQQQSMALRDQLNKTSNKDSIDLLNQDLQNMHNDVMAHWDKSITENKGTFFALFLKALQDVKVPEVTVDETVSNRDSVIQMRKYYYYRNHYFDNIDLTDERMLRTPIFANKIEHFIEKIVMQVPDTIATESIKLIEKCRTNPEMYKFMIQYLFNYAVESKMMGMDAVVVALGEKYYLSGEVTWVDDEFKSDLQDRIKLLKPTLIGKKAHDLTMQSATGEYYRLSEVIAPYTILVFWEPNCGHCKKEVPKIKTDVLDKYKSKGIKVFAVYTQNEKEMWQTFVEDHDLYDFINVYDPYHSSRFRDFYDISSTPVIYILDKDKKIVAKRIGVENLPGFFEHEIKYGRL